MSRVAGGTAVAQTEDAADRRARGAYNTGLLRAAELIKEAIDAAEPGPIRWALLRTGERIVAEIRKPPP